MLKKQVKYYQTPPLYQINFRLSLFCHKDFFSLSQNRHKFITFQRYTFVNLCNQLQEFWDSPKFWTT